MKADTRFNDLTEQGVSDTYARILLTIFNQLFADVTVTALSLGLKDNLTGKAHRFFVTRTTAIGKSLDEWDVDLDQQFVLGGYYHRKFNLGTLGVLLEPLA